MNDFKKHLPVQKDSAPVIETFLDLTFNDLDMCIEPISAE
jgi:hypothetical protein